MLSEINSKAVHIKLADELQEIVDEIRNINAHDVFRAVIVLDGKTSIESKSLGAPLRIHEALGLLEFAKLKAAIDVNE